LFYFILFIFFRIGRDGDDKQTTKATTQKEQAPKENNGQQHQN